MHRKGIDGVVNLHQLQQRGSTLIDQATNNGNEESTAALHVATWSCDRDQPCEDAVAKAADVVLTASHSQAQQEDNKATGGGSDGGVHGHLCSHEARGNTAHAQCGAAVESIPAEPQDEGAQGDEGQTVGRKLIWIREAARAWPCNDGPHQCTDSSGHVHNSAASKIHESHAVDRCKPSVAPGPCDNDRVHKGSHEEGVETVAAEVHALRHATAHDSGGCRAEGPLKEPIEHARGGLELSIPGIVDEADAEKLFSSDESIVQKAVIIHWPAIGKGPARDPPADGADANIGQVLQQNVLHILGTAAA
mmetsp:Transcript_57077/g.136065  ORF Transcript_57077/g.136065 Transcript_57077/m.136065 type:complete len:306 (-) Transcript_57077:367-1284(-)